MKILRRQDVVVAAENIMDAAGGDGMTLAAGRLSLDYLNLLFSDYAGLDALYAAASQMQWALDAGPGVGPAAAAVNLIATAWAAYTHQPRALAGREPAGGRQGAKKAAAGKQTDELSEREKACLSWAAVGKSSWEIGRILAISENTVIFHIKNAMRKLGANSRTLAALKAVQLGLIEPAVETEPAGRSPGVRRRGASYQT
jgi:DNA-binding CsgD family transcriptional regulator